jgi:hypothetical protein
MGGRLTCDVSEQVVVVVVVVVYELGEGGNGPPATFLSALNGINTSRTYLMRFDNNNMIGALSSVENKLYRI